MTQLLGEYNCKLDAKGRFILPSGLQKQVPAEAGNQFVVNRGFEQCLVLYPRNEWDKIAAEINKLNKFIKRNRDFIRYFFRGATEITLDGSDRILLPKHLLTYAGIQKQIVLFAHTNKIEIWHQETYDNLLSDEPEDFADLAEQVMGNAIQDDENQTSES